MASFRSSNPDYSSSITNQFSSKSGYVYETAPPPTPYPVMYDSDSDDEDDLLEALRKLLLRGKVSKRSTRMQAAPWMLEGKKLRELTEQKNITVTPELMDEAIPLLQSGKTAEEILNMLLEEQQEEEDSEPSSYVHSASKTADERQPDSTQVSDEPEGKKMSRSELRQYNNVRGQIQTWSQERVRVPVWPPNKEEMAAPEDTSTPPGLKEKVLAKARQLGSPYQEQIEDAVNSGIPLQTIIDMIPGGVEGDNTPVVDDSITKDEVYRKAFFLPPSQKQLVHDALKKGIKPSLVASKIPDQVNVPLNTFVIIASIVAMVLSIVLA